MTAGPRGQTEAQSNALGGFRRLCAVTFLLIFALIVIGGTVRATDSGLGCPDWPTCHGHVIPRFEKHTLIEYSHRLVASIAGVLVLAIAYKAWRHFRRQPRLLIPSVGALALIAVQAGLGGAAVLNDLPPEIVAVHLAVALTILGVVMLLWLTAFALELPPPRPLVSPYLARLALVTAAATLALMLVGAYVSGAGYGRACSGWPLCNGDVLPDTGSVSVATHFLHRVLALVLGVLLLLLLRRGWEERFVEPTTAVLAPLAFFVYLAQALIGAVNAWTGVADLASIAHLAVGTLLWCLLVLLNIRLLRLYELLPEAWRHRQEPRLAGAAR